MELSKLSRVCDSAEDNAVLSMLYRALSEEIHAWYQYWIAVPMLVGKERKNIEDSFTEFADDELNDHALKLRKRIEELGGSFEPINNPLSWSSHAGSPYIIPCPSGDVRTLVEQNIAAETSAIETYTQLCDMTRGVDYNTYTISKQILMDEQEHLNELQNYLEDILNQ